MNIGWYTKKGIVHSDEEIVIGEGGRIKQMIPAHHIVIAHDSYGKDKIVAYDVICFVIVESIEHDGGKPMLLSEIYPVVEEDPGCLTPLTSWEGIYDASTPLEEIEKIRKGWEAAYKKQVKK